MVDATELRTVVMEVQPTGSPGLVIVTTRCKLPVLMDNHTFTFRYPVRRDTWDGANPDAVPDFPPRVGDVIHLRGELVRVERS